VGGNCEEVKGKGGGRKEIRDDDLFRERMEGGDCESLQCGIGVEHTTEQKPIFLLSMY